ncbi:helix-turn-helix domain-containing protein [Pseudooceanicola nanhaiensis]|uniref:helix-turn-helix domain-containing protein n=1 Tax=Pseudooceanicola nanhaiensis TaxID=375761 RepID=UPI001CD5A9A7|nr:helix-turn-helix domain-containing protein [Pseudooceanicola nanhaiensis]MCA0922826.1 replication protein C [Pseudooceanicola nanhaiensis]
MEEIRGSAISAEAQSHCAHPQGAAFAGLGTIAQQPYFKAVRRRDLMAAVNTLARDLGLRASGVMVLDALLSCLPCKEPKTGAELPITPLTLLTVYAANETLCFRAKGITERQLRRHLERFEEIGLLARRDSANGKRFPVQRGGKTIGAFGLDLSPLLARSEELLARAESRRREAEELKGLKACIHKLRARCLALDLDQATAAFVEGLRNSLRRVGLTRQEAIRMMDDLAALLDPVETPPAEQAMQDAVEPQSAVKTAKMTATDGRNDRHKEPENSDPEKRGDVTAVDVWPDLPTLSMFYPEPPKTPQALRTILHDFAAMLRIGQGTLIAALRSHGLFATLRSLDQLASKAHEIERPDGYLQAMLRGERSERVGHGQLC